MSNTLIKNIRFLMARHGIKTQNMLSKKTKIPQPTIYRWMNFPSIEPRQSSLKSLADFFNVTTLDLLEVDLSNGQVSSEVQSDKREIKNLFAACYRTFDAFQLSSLTLDQVAALGDLAKALQIADPHGLMRP